ncbi:histidine phosphatase family protein [Bacillus alkalicellulosilyticus]|uniref:histidine phosphatase family protein n=1 Tax=Alkalihalobacterium alkalicellulosilyticum TaxID=1912214 RepID=UPI000995FC77|nr:histidine phosphatase family protein [Bacillus alkalicellulosilyticus]
MELIFIRHGQGEHTINIPTSLQNPDPALTKDGTIQAKSLRNQFPLSEDDIIIISPIRRTLQTALIWSDSINCRKIVTPLVSPRMFPQNPEWNPLPCDIILKKEMIKEEFLGIDIDEDLPISLWIKGINTLSEYEFTSLADNFLKWCKQLGKKRIYIISHDGTRLDKD